MDEQLAMIAELIAWFAEKDIRCAMVVAPINPRLAEAFGDEEANRIMDQLTQLAESSDTPLLDHRRLLSVTDYADHVHPIESGRVIWSGKLAEDLAELIHDGGAD